MAGRTFWFEDLIFVVHRGIVATQAGLSVHFFEECSRATDMAEAALLAEDRVGCRERAAGICPLSALSALGDQPA
jgi:hypothetical protein